MMNILFGTWPRRIATFLVLVFAFLASLTGTLTVAVLRTPVAASAAGKIPLIGPTAIAIARWYRPPASAEPPRPEVRTLRQLRPLSAEEITALIEDLQKQQRLYKEKIAFIEREEKRLEMSRAELAQERERLEKLREQIASQWADCQRARAALEGQMTDMVSTEANNLKQLAATYEAMKPEKAATIVSKLDETLAAKTLFLMRERSMAKILENLDQETAARLTERIRLLKRND